MLEKIFHYLGYLPKKDFDEKSTQLMTLSGENLKLRSEIKVLRGVELPFISIDDGEQIPIDQEERKLYVAQIAGFHKDIMDKKILAMIAGVRAQLGKLDSTLDNNGRKITQYSPQDFDLILKGTENAFWLLHDWGKEMISEHMENQRGITSEEREDLQAKIIET